MESEFLQNELFILVLPNVSSRLDRLSTTLTQSLIRYTTFSQTRPPRRRDSLAPLWESCR